jgi:putative ABC transport system substrate-binding protein
MKKAGLSSILVAAAVLAVGVIAEAQQPKKVPQIGFLIGASATSVAARLDAFRQGLCYLGYVEGKNIVIEYRYAETGPLQGPSIEIREIFLQLSKEFS